MADTKINFTIPEVKVQRVIDAMKGLYPIPQIDNPKWVDPEDGSSAPMINEFTDSQWAKESVRRWIVKQVARFEKSEAIKNIKVPEDDSIIG